jgi:UDP-N-acetyl-D-galactosamine dehydrogenase
MPLLEKQICIVGLGYVGLPLAAALARAGFAVSGYDISAGRIAELQRGHDRTNELTADQLQAVSIAYATDPAVIASADIVIVTVPTPIDAKNDPDLSPVVSAMETIGKRLKKGAIVVLESTVYPGVMEEICAPILEKESGLKCGTDFTLGYSPERINPGDREHTVDKIAKVVAGQDAATLDILAELYGKVTSGGIHRAPSIKVAEMAKAIENAQRDLNIAYVNEIALLCGRLGIRTKDVLDAAGTKWNFLKFQPGLVGGHCIGVDPYYLVEKARQLGMTTHVISAGRAVNDGMAAEVVNRALAVLGDAAGKRALVLGLTFKEDIPDTRNSKSFDVINALAAAGLEAHGHDPEAHPAVLEHENVVAGDRENGGDDAVFWLVPHRAYRDLAPADWQRLVKPGGVLFDLKSLLDPAMLPDRTLLSL